MPVSPPCHGAYHHDGDGTETKIGSDSAPGALEAHSARLFALSANMATRTSPELPRACFAWLFALNMEV
eukprot:4593088-Alexandrium_andersonii.AAC.1